MPILMRWETVSMSRKQFLEQAGVFAGSFQNRNLFVRQIFRRVNFDLHVQVAGLFARFNTLSLEAQLGAVLCAGRNFDFNPVAIRIDHVPTDTHDGFQRIDGACDV